MTFLVNLTLFEIYFMKLINKYCNLKYIINKNILHIYNNTFKKFYINIQMLTNSQNIMYFLIISSI